MTQPNTTNTGNSSTSTTGATWPLQYGQTFTPSGLIYTTTNSAGEAWFCDSNRVHAPLARIHEHHPINVGDLGNGMQQLGRTRWTDASVERFKAGGSVSAHEVLQEVHDYIADYFVATEDLRALLAVYVMLTYLFTVAETVPYLHLLGEPATGKTLVGDLLEGLCFNARQAATISAPAVYRLLHETTGTLIIDEQGAGNRTWGNVLRAGYRRSGVVTICEGDTPVERRCFGPKVLLTNEPLEDSALASRCITVAMSPTTQRAKRYSTFAVAERVGGLRDRLHEFGLCHANAVWSTYRDQPDVPGLAHREADLAAPLLAVAAVIDASNAGGGQLTRILTTLLQAGAAERAAGQRVDGERGAIARAIVRFVTPGTDDQGTAYSWHGDPDWYLGSDFTRFLNKSGELSRQMTSREVGERMKRFELAVARQVIDVRPGRGPIDRHAPRVQRVAYKFNKTKVEESTGRLP